jgi:uncharacterized protein YjbJ (UPF0337 family)
MEHDDHDQPEKPATWENIVVGKAKEAIGRVIGDEELAAEGEEQDEVAHQVRAEYENEHQS